VVVVSVAIIGAKVPYSDRLRRMRNAGCGTPGGCRRASELMWQLLPPVAMATERVVITALFTDCADRDRMRVGDRWRVRISVWGTKNVLARLPRAVSSAYRDDFQTQGLDHRENPLNAVVVDLARDHCFGGHLGEVHPLEGGACSLRETA
jgi:hypothetical protein